MSLTEAKESKDKKQQEEEEVVDEHEESPLYLIDFFRQLHTTSRLSDVTFIVGPEKKEFHAHRFVLAASSPLFAAMLFPPKFPDYKHAEAKRSKPREVVVKDVKVDVFEALLRSIYTDELEVNVENLTDLIDVAKKYQIEKIQVMCAAFMEGDVNIDNALELYQLAPELLGDKAFAIKFIRDNTEEVFQSDAFEKLQPERLRSLVKDNKLSIDEIVLFHDIVRWGKEEFKRQTKKQTCEPHELKSVLKDILPLIRFPLMEMSDLAGAVAASGLLEQDKLLELFKYVSIEDPKLRELAKVSFPTESRSGNFQIMGGPSKILEKKFNKDILLLFGEQKNPAKKVHLQLLYQGSRDGFTPQAFHAKCDNKGPTFTVIRPLVGKNVFGGYTQGSWAGSGTYSTAPSWIYSLVNKTGKVVKQLPSSSSNNAYCNNSYGPTWGGGHDLHVNSNMKGTSTNYCNPSTYTVVAPGYGPYTYDNSLIAGAYNFVVDEIEVYEVKKHEKP